MKRIIIVLIMLSTLFMVGCTETEPKGMVQIHIEGLNNISCSDFCALYVEDLDSTGKVFSDIVDGKMEGQYCKCYNKILPRRCCNSFCN